MKATQADSLVNSRLIRLIQAWGRTIGERHDGRYEQLAYGCYTRCDAVGN